MQDEIDFGSDQNNLREGMESRHIVVIGASAGGLRALEAFFAAMPDDSNLIFVIVMHMAQDQESRVVEVLQSRTSMKVLPIVSGTALHTNVVYTLSGNRKLTIENDVMIMGAPLGNPIDHVFRYFAQGSRDRLTAIILSGSGIDGAAGVKEVKEAGGLVIVQDPESADHKEMPQTAIDTMACDFVLAPSQIPTYVSKWSENSRRIKNGLMDSTDRSIDLHRILFLLKSHTGHNFALYKKIRLGEELNDG